MRLAGRRSPPRGERSGRQDSNLRLPAPEAGGVPAPQRPDEWPPASSAPGFQSSGGRARTCALAGNNRASYRLDHAGIHGPGRRRTCTAPGKSRELCRVELRSLAGCGRHESNLRRPAFQAGALPAELRPRDGRGWVRTSGLLCVRQALSRSELLARSVSAPVRLAALPSISPGGDRRYERPLLPCPLSRRPKPNDVFQATRLPFDPGSHVGGCAAAERPSFVEELWSPMLVPRA